MRLKLRIENLSIISKSVINNLAVTFFLYIRFYGKVLFNGDINVLFLQLLS